VLKLRILTAAVLIPVFIIAVLYLNTASFAVLMATVIALAAWEWAGIAGFSGSLKRAGYTLAVITLLILTYIFRSGSLPVWILSIALLWWGLAIHLVLRYQNHQSLDFTIPAKALIGLVVLLPAWLSLLVLHAFEPDGVLLVLFLLVLIWSADIAAYFAGRRWGKHKLCSRVSPGKSWEGVFGALAASVALAFIYALYVQLQGVELLIFITICIITVLASILGDLLESLMKRISKMKDSGSILPGHGGVLDRIDSLTAALPIFLCSLWIWEKIV
jgi:phosphatidate cytidylyltransferase